MAEPSTAPIADTRVIAAEAASEAPGARLTPFVQKFDANLSVDHNDEQPGELLIVYTPADGQEIRRLVGTFELTDTAAVDAALAQVATDLVLQAHANAAATELEHPQAGKFQVKDGVMTLAGKEVQSNFIMNESMVAGGIAGVVDSFKDSVTQAITEHKATLNVATPQEDGIDTARSPVDLTFLNQSAKDFSLQAPNAQTIASTLGTKSERPYWTNQARQNFTNTWGENLAGVKPRLVAVAVTQHQKMHEHFNLYAEKHNGYPLKADGLYGGGTHEKGDVAMLAALKAAAGETDLATKTAFRRYAVDIAAKGGTQDINEAAQAFAEIVKDASFKAPDIAAVEPRLTKHQRAVHAFENTWNLNLGAKTAGDVFTKTVHHQRLLQAYELYDNPKFTNPETGKTYALKVDGDYGDGTRLEGDDKVIDILTREMGDKPVTVETQGQFYAKMIENREAGGTMGLDGLVGLAREFAASVAAEEIPTIAADPIATAMEAANITESVDRELFRARVGWQPDADVTALATGFAAEFATIKSMVPADKVAEFYEQAVRTSAIEDPADLETLAATFRPATETPAAAEEVDPRVLIGQAATEAGIPEELNDVFLWRVSHDGIDPKEDSEGLKTLATGFAAGYEGVKNAATNAEAIDTSAEAIQAFYQDVVKNGFLDSPEALNGQAIEFADKQKAAAALAHADQELDKITDTTEATFASIKSDPDAVIGFLAALQENAGTREKAEVYAKKLGLHLSTKPTEGARGVYSLLDEGVNAGTISREFLTYFDFKADPTQFKDIQAELALIIQQDTDHFVEQFESVQSLGTWMGTLFTEEKHPWVDELATFAMSSETSAPIFAEGFANALTVKNLSSLSPEVLRLLQRQLKDVETEGGGVNRNDVTVELAKRESAPADG